MNTQTVWKSSGVIGTCGGGLLRHVRGVGACERQVDEDLQELRQLPRRGVDVGGGRRAVGGGGSRGGGAEVQPERFERPKREVAREERAVTK